MTARSDSRGSVATIGVDIGGTKMLGVMLGADDVVVAEVRIPTPQSATEPADVLAVGSELAGVEVADAVRHVVEALRRDAGTATGAGAGTGDPCSVGVGMPGMLDLDGVLRFSPNLPGAVGTDIGALIGTRLAQSEVVVENDANCAALAEHRLGAARGLDHALVVTLGTGIGGGVIIDGRVFPGSFGFAGEIGHMIVDPTGPPCPCGRRGCWERYASGGGLGRLAREAAFAGRLHAVMTLAGGDPESVRGEHVTRAARAGDPGALDVLGELGWWIALGLANLSAVLDPECFVLGGGLAEEGELLVGPTRNAYATLVEGSASRPEVPILAAALGERAGAIGAALAARSGGLA